MLRPQDSSTRERKSLNGLWDFRLDSEREGRAARWFSQSLPDSRQMAVQQSCASAATKRASSLVIASQGRSVRAAPPLAQRSLRKSLGNVSPTCVRHAMWTLWGFSEIRENSKQSVAARLPRTSND